MKRVMLFFALLVGLGIQTYASGGPLEKIKPETSKPETTTVEVEKTDSKIVKVNVDLGGIAVEEAQSLLDGLSAGLAKMEDLECEVSIKGKVNFGLFNGDVSVTVRGDCDEVEGELKARANSILKSMH